MKNITITPMPLSGSVTIPASKSVCHRAVICAALAEGTSRISGILLSDDILATIWAMETLGAVIRQESADTLLITGTNCQNVENSTIFCKESGSTLRFMIPLALTGAAMTFAGEGKLVERPLTDYFNIFDTQQIPYSTTDGRLPLTVTGTLQPGTFHLRGDVSSQFVSGLLFALPRLNGDSSIIITTEMESKGYIDLTLDMLARFGITVINKDYREFIIPGRQTYRSTNYHVESDYSQVAFWLVAGSIGHSVTCLGLNPDSLQGDKVITDIIASMQGQLSISPGSILAAPSATCGAIIDAAQCPDLVPVLTVLAAVSRGTTKVINAARLRIKECDRLKAMATELNKLGAHVEEHEDSLTIHGVESLTGGVVHSWDDHRIAMAMGIASIKCTTPLTIINSACVSKSYPGFWQDFQSLGGQLHECHLGQ